jgi:endonuclease YncB( thermonuclease family)
MLGPYDIGAAIVNAGWAIADTRQTQVYLSYQNQASQAKRGLWEGKFYTPWDWQKIKSRKANIKILKPKNQKRKSVWSNVF